MFRLEPRTARALVATAVVAATLAMAPASASLVNKPARTWGTNGRVLALLPVGDRIFVGGTFSSVIDTSGVSSPAENLAVFSATTGRADLAFGVGADNTVEALATDGVSTLYLGGQFGTVSHGTTVPRAGLAAVDLTTGEVAEWAPAVAGGQVDALAYEAATDSLYAAGNFTSVTGAGGSVSPHAYVARISAATGAVDTGFAAAPDGRVRALDVAADGSGRLFMGGDFLSVSGAAKTRALTAVALATGAVDSAFRPGATNQTNLAPVLDIVSDATLVYVAAAGSGGACTALSGATGTVIWSDHANGNMQAVRLIGSTLYCGGHFGGNGSFAGVKRQKLAAVSAGTGGLLAFNPNINSTLGTWALGTQPGDPNLYLGGDFTKVSAVTQPHFAMFVDTTLQAPPQPPGDLVAQPATDRIQLSWSVPSSDGGQAIKSYLVYRGTAAGAENMNTPIATLGATATGYDDTAVSSGTTYYYVVAATNALGTGALSNEASADLDGGTTVTPPGPPAAVTIANPPGTLDLTWNPPPDNGGAPVTGYHLYRGTAPGEEGTTPYVSGITATAFSDAFGLVAGTTYYYRVSAVNPAGEGALSAEVSAVMQPGKPGPPVLSGSSSSGAVHLDWTVPPDGGTPILKYVLLRDGVRLAGNLPPTQTSYDDATVVAGQTYVYQVRAVNAQGGGQLSNRVTITP